ncbi:ABC transporter permease [Oceanobacillus rekensis]|uniref:ABC transporter permease n=1 Tax=Oceanobacillus rekensis TaxID=937927 RepID=UPI000B43BD72|nr:ABC transporter permease [Oceanobacillus rekensis]
MKPIIQTRLIHWKKQWPSLIFWLVLPLIATLFIINMTSIVQEDSKIPIGIVMEENTPMANNLLKSIKASPLIRVYDLSESEAKQLIESHELDSAFVIESGYQQQIKDGNRNRLITGYQSDLSFAYTPVSEMIISYVQQDTGKAKAAHTIMNVAENIDPDTRYSFDEIINKIQEVQSQENLIRTNFSFSNMVENDHKEELTVWNIWGLWAIFSILSTLLLSDWIIKEKYSGILPRFAFIRFSFKSYLIQNVFLYSSILFIFDSLAALGFHYFLNEPVSLKLVGAIIAFRITCSAGAFLLALLFKHIYLFYNVSFTLVLWITITSGAIFPIERLTDRFPWLTYLNPLHPFLNQEFWGLWMIIFIVIIGIWFAKGEKLNA